MSQPVGLDFASASGFCQWVWILPVGLDVPVGLDMKTPWASLPLYHVIYTQPCHKGCLTLNDPKDQHQIFVSLFKDACEMQIHCRDKRMRANYVARKVTEINDLMEQRQNIIAGSEK